MNNRDLRNSILFSFLEDVDLSHRSHSKASTSVSDVAPMAPMAPFEKGSKSHLLILSRILLQFTQSTIRCDKQMMVHIGFPFNDRLSIFNDPLTARIICKLNSKDVNEI